MLSRMEDDVVLVPEAAAELGVSRYTVWRYIDSKRLPARRLGRDWLIRRIDLAALKADMPKRGRPRKPPAHQ